MPEEHEETNAGFEHYKEAELPFLEGEGKQVRVMLGNAWAKRAPSKTFCEMFYADVVLERDALLTLPDDHEGRGPYVALGSIEVAGDTFEAGQMMVFRPGDRIAVNAGCSGAPLMALGGETLNVSRHIWWNFVASSCDKTEAAKVAWAAGDWAHGRLQLLSDDNEEFISPQ